MLFGSVIFVSIGGLVVMVSAFGSIAMDALEQKKINSLTEDWALVLSETFHGAPEEAWEYMLKQFPIEERFQAKAKLVFFNEYW